MESHRIHPTTLPSDYSSIVLRGDIARLERCTAITTGSGEKGLAVKRSKPFKYAYEKEIVMYAYFKVGRSIPLQWPSLVAANSQS